jgi:hypothetical protein
VGAQRSKWERRGVHRSHATPARIYRILGFQRWLERRTARIRRELLGDAKGGTAGRAE